MKSYDTPRSVAAALARHAPQRIERLLDPAAGHGALVEAVSAKMVASGGRAVCIDVDSSILAECKSRLRSLRAVTAEYLNVDFLKWRAERQRFDCVIMNPPFGAKKQHEVPLDLMGLPSDCRARKEAPLEVAFVLKAIDLLERGGRLLAVLPSSVILGQSFVWLRRYLCDTGRIRCVHELPRFTFSEVESRIYLLVFDKEGRSTSVTLLNHDLRLPSSIRVMRSMLDPELRLDFGFCSSSASLRETMSRTPGLAWTKLGACATVFRGRGISPHRLQRSLHTTDYSAENWDFSKRSGAIAEDWSDRGLRLGDLLVKRVGRNCSRTLRLNRSLDHKQCSDCVLVVRPSKLATSVRLLLAARVLLESRVGPSLMERGSGASYITENAMQSLTIPLALSELDLSLYRRYRYAVARQNLGRVRAIEAEFRQRIGLASGEPSPLLAQRKAFRGSLPVGVT
jgi:tRNA1(Val) A37 N6-methylase TrmN6